MITPMVARLVRDQFDRADWLFELKWDGFRAIAKVDGKGQVSSTPDAITRFPPLIDALAD